MTLQPNLNDHRATMPPLHLAAALGDLERVAALLIGGEDPLRLDPVMGTSALHLAAQGGNAEVVSSLIRHGALGNLQSHSHGMTPLMVAVWHRRPAIARVLLAHPQIDPSIRSRLGVKAEEMIDGSTEQDRELVAIFAEFRHRAEQTRKSQLLLAALEDPLSSAAEKEAQVVRLLAAGADPNAIAPIDDPANPGHTALLIASRDGLAVAAQALLDVGAEIARVDHFMLAHSAHKAAYMGHADVMRVLAYDTHFGRIANAQGPFNGYTALHDAVWHGHAETVRVLLDAGVRLEPRGHDGRTAADMARDYGYDEIVGMLDAAAAEGHVGRRAPSGGNHTKASLAPA